MPIAGETVDSDGNYRNNEIRDKILLVEAWDADCGKWGISLEVFRFLACALACGLVSAYVLGAIDFVFYEKLTTEQWWWKTAILALTFYVTLGLVLSHMMYVVMRADDECIGNSAVPLEILTDQRGHALFLTLRQRRNERGILRVRLYLSEN